MQNIEPQDRRDCFYSNGRLNWDVMFKACHLNSGPNSHGVTISKIKPNGMGARSLWDDDKKEILNAASKYGYCILVESDKLITFIKK